MYPLSSDSTSSIFFLLPGSPTKRSKSNNEVILGNHDYLIVCATYLSYVQIMLLLDFNHGETHIIV